ncbi:reverse transcriptase domain-containing protein, partial [Tanacetum coccineum]
VEAKSLPTNDAWVVVKFLKQLFSRFGTPRTIISDRGLCTEKLVIYPLSSSTKPTGRLSGLVLTLRLRRVLVAVLKTFSHSDLGNKPLPISFLGSGLVSYLHSGLPTFLSSGLELTAVDTVAVYRFLKIISHRDLGIKPLPISFLGSGLVFLLHSGLPLVAVYR